MVHYKIKSFPSPSKPKGKDDLNSEPDEEEKSDSLN